MHANTVVFHQEMHQRVWKVARNAAYHHELPVMHNIGMTSNHTTSHGDLCDILQALGSRGCVATDELIGAGQIAARVIGHVLRP